MSRVYLRASARGAKINLVCSCKALCSLIKTAANSRSSRSTRKGCYYFGVVDCINKYIPKKRVRRVAGASAGALIGAYYLLDLPLNTVLRQIIDMLNDFRRRPLGVFDRSNQIVDILPRLLDQFFPDDAHKRVSGRLFVGMTRWRDRKNVIVSEFESKKDLIDVSAFRAPLLLSYAHEFN